MIKSKHFDDAARVRATVGAQVCAPFGSPASLSRQVGIRRHSACFFAIFLCICAVVVASPLLQSSAQPAPQQPATATAAARNAALVAATDEVLKETSELRQLSIIKPVQSSTQSREEIQRAIIKNLSEETSAADLHASEIILKKLGLAPADFNYREMMVRLLTEQVAGYYEPKTQQFHLADWIDVDGQRPVMAHELTHALQDQHFNLRRFEKWPKGDSDAELAAHSLIEGDATLAMVLYIANNPLRALTFLKSIGTMAGASEELNKAPRAVRESLLFPYQEGLNWTRELYRLGGWKEVSEAFNTLPQSTEQILHPAKYLAGEAPVKVVLPDLAPLLNAAERSQESGDGRRNSRTASSQRLSPAPVPGLLTPSWKRISSDVNGEFGLYLILDQYLKSPAESRRAAAGWGGDRFDLYENATGEVVFVSTSAWDTENDAREFFDAYAKRVQLQYPTAERTNAGAVATFATGDGEVLVALKGQRVFTIGTPRSLKAESLLCALDSNAPNCRPPLAMLFSH
jgi:hypothetical protein